jgi:glucose-6-phosphate 1-dehydrogenase
MSIVNTSSDIVIFGAMGDLAQRKLIPALFQLESAELLGQDTRIIGVARHDEDNDSFCNICEASLNKFVKTHELEAEALTRFLAKVEYCPVNFTEADSYQELKNSLDMSAERARIFYYATPASIYGSISKNLTKSNCINTNSCVVLEKPIGHNLRSSNEVNDQVAEYFDETQIYRIDHYLGKETVQNLIAYALPTHCLVHSGIKATSLRLKLPWQRKSALRAAGATSIKRARCGTWYKTTCYSCSVSRRWTHRMTCQPI